MVIKETTAYKGEFLKIDCPYCEAENYIDVADDYGEGYIPDNGRKMTCRECGKTMRAYPMEGY